MSRAQELDFPPSPEKNAPPPSILERWRLPLLCLFLILALGYNILLAVVAAPADSSTAVLVPLELIGFLPYLAVCLLVLLTRPPTGRRQWIELAVILVGALSLRALLLHVPPGLSHDSWRYLWDARVTLHGYSPYVYPPEDSRFASLRDFIYDNSRFRTVPTIYPPGAQAVYLLSYVIAPSNLFVLKGIFLLCDMVTCGALAFWLKQKGSDPARCLIYAWCPLPIIEFAIQGHVDALTIAVTLLAVICAQSSWRGARVCTGFLLAMATLTKIYPIILLVVVLRRRDWALLATCGATLILAYIPYIILGHGQILGFFSTYASEQTPNEGLVPLIIQAMGMQMRLGTMVTLAVTYLFDLVIVAVVSLVIWQLRQSERISMEAAALLLIGTVFVVSSHIFPWYTPALLPWIVILVGPLWMREKRLSGKGLAVAIAWYFTCASVIAYLFDGKPDWSLYYALVYAMVMVGLGVAAIVGRGYWRSLSELPICSILLPSIRLRKK